MVLEQLSPTDALYFTVVTVATVGYGDITPATFAGKALATVLIIAGVASFSGFIVNGTQLLLERRQEHRRIERLNMLISLFFTEMGTHFLNLLVSLDPGVDNFRSEVSIDSGWDDDKFIRLTTQLKNYSFRIEPRFTDLESLRLYLSQNGALLVRLLENPTLTERESFTELLRATLHFRDELILRGNLSDSPKADIEHMANDARRVYGALTSEWVEYMRYLKKNYPYLFSLALRTNPFSKNRSPVLT